MPLFCRMKVAAPEGVPIKHTDSHCCVNFLLCLYLAQSFEMFFQNGAFVSALASLFRLFFIHFVARIVHNKTAFASPERRKILGFVLI